MARIERLPAAAGDDPDPPAPPRVGPLLDAKGASQLLTAEQLAERWQVPTSHVYRLAREARVPCVRLGRYVRFRLDEIERFELGGHTNSRTAA